MISIPESCQDRLSKYSKVYNASVEISDAEMSFSIYCRITGYIDALCDIGLIETTKKDQVIYEYTH